MFSEQYGDNIATTEHTPLLYSKKELSFSDSTVSTHENTIESYSDIDQESQRSVPKVIYEENFGAECAGGFSSDDNDGGFFYAAPKSTEEAPKDSPFDQPVTSLGIVEEVQDAAGALMEELREADDADNYFLEMGLMRNLSILPEDLPRAADSADEQQHGEAASLFPTDKNSETTQTSSGPPLGAYLLLVVAIVSLSSVGPLLQIQHNVSPTMKIYWRMAMTAILLLPFAVREVYKQGIPRLTPSQWCTFLISTASFDVFCVAFVISLDFTAVGNAVIFSNSLSLILLVGKIFVGQSITFLEGAGASIAFSGAILCSKDSAEGGAHSSSEAMFGDFIALLAAFGGVGYLITAKASRVHIPLYTFMFLTMSVGCAFILVFQIFALREEVTFDMDIQHGIWGFLNVHEPDRLPLEIVMAVVSNGLGTLGYVQSMKYFDNIVLSSATLLQPVIAEFLAFGFGAGVLPGWQGWLGNALVVGGTFAVVFPKPTPTEAKDKKTAIVDDDNSLVTVTSSEYDNNSGGTVTA